jgi:hypothetical protein
MTWTGGLPASSKQFKCILSTIHTLTEDVFEFLFIRFGSYSLDLNSEKYKENAQSCKTMYS